MANFHTHNFEGDVSGGFSSQCKILMIEDNDDISEGKIDDKLVANEFLSSVSSEED